MSARTLAERLVDGSLPGGVYRVSARLVAEGGGAASRWQRLPAPTRWTRETLLDALAATLAFPQHFGRNWDAAWDCLTELEWGESEVRVIVLPPGSAAPDGVAMAAFVALMRDAGEHWARRRRALITLIVEEEGAEQDTPGWLSGVAPL